MWTHMSNRAICLFWQIVFYTIRCNFKLHSITDSIYCTFPYTPQFIKILIWYVPKLYTVKYIFPIIFFLKDNKQELGRGDIIVQLRTFPFSFFAQFDKFKSRE